MEVIVEAIEIRSQEYRVRRWDDAAVPSIYLETLVSAVSALSAIHAAIERGDWA